MASRKFRSIKGRRMRLTALDECGNPDYTNPRGHIVTSGFITVTWSNEVEEGEEYTQKNAWGDFCIAEKDGDRTKWLNLAVSMCEIDPEVLVMLAGAEANIEDDEMIGAFFGQDVNPTAFAIEVWTKNPGNACADGGDPTWGYFAAVNVRNGTLDGDLTIENGPLALNMKGQGLGASEEWGVGPYGDNPIKSASGFLPGRLRYIGVTHVQPPEPTDGATAIIEATGATAGLPGTWTPVNAGPPLTLDDLTGVTASPATAWTAGQHVVLGNGQHANWNATAWAAGDA
jgi:hypothetical protein